jgi:hypothetical protein
MELERRDTDNLAMRTKLKGAIVKVLRKAKPGGARAKRSPGARRPGGYVRLAHTGFKKIFKGEPLMFGPRLNVADPAPSMDWDADRVRLVALAMDSLSPASARTACHGRPVTVTVPDEATAAVFRKALELTVAHRPTDGLINIKVRGD